MFANVQVNEFKPLAIRVANEALINGAPVTYDPATGKLSKGTGDVDYVVVSAENYDGINAIIEPSDDSFENIAEGALCIMFPMQLGSRIATTELTKGSLAVGDGLTASSGKFVAATGDAKYAYCGEYDNPWGLDMYIVERMDVAAD